MRNTYYKKGDWNVICDICGFKKKFSETSINWKNQVVCSDTCYEDRHPQDFVFGKADKQTVPIARPEQPDKFVDYP